MGYHCYKAFSWLAACLVAGVRITPQQKQPSQQPSQSQPHLQPHPKSHLRGKHLSNNNYNTDDVIVMIPAAPVGLEGVRIAVTPDNTIGPVDKLELVGNEIPPLLVVAEVAVVIEEVAGTTVLLETIGRMNRIMVFHIIIRGLSVSVG